MVVEAQIAINCCAAEIWAVITDLEHAAETISGIQTIEILERPAQGLAGLKWRETRTLFGQTATEVMWITDAVEPAYYETRAESHGSVYISTWRITEGDGGCRLGMSLDSRPQSIGARLMAIPFGLMFRSATRKAMLQDLQDIKAAVEARASGGDSFSPAAV